VAADIILPLLDLCFRVVGHCTCHVDLAGERVESLGIALPSVDNLHYLAYGYVMDILISNCLWTYICMLRYYFGGYRHHVASRSLIILIGCIW
jgi:hypothetical protein